METTIFQKLDYIFFFYGLSFILLAAVCFTIKKEEKSPLLWNWFGYFGLAHGLNEWLDLLAFTFYDRPGFVLLRSLLMGASFYFLAAFGRRSRLPLTGKALSPWVYLPVTLLALTGCLYGPYGFNATIRLALGLPGAMLAAYAVWLASAKENHARNPLRLISAALVIYALAAGLVLPESGLPVSRYLGYSNFGNTFGFPVQLLRALIATILACAVWQYSLALNPKGKRREIKARLGWSAIAALLLAAALGWEFTDLMGARSYEDMAQNAESLKRILHNRIAESLSSADRTARTMSGSPWVDLGAASGGTEDLARANSVLDRYCESYDFAVCYLADLKGKVVASSNRGTPHSLVGKNFSFRPYFAAAAAGREGKYYARGIATDERGYYASAPVKSGGRVTGVVVVKKNLEFLAEELKMFQHVYLVSPEGIIFLSCDRGMIFRALWPVRPDKRGWTDMGQQFGKVNLDPVLQAEPLDDSEITFGGERFYISRAYFDNSGWSVISFTSTQPVRTARFAGITVSLVFCVILLISFITLMQSESARENAEALLALKSEVETLSGILPICAGCKKIRDDKGYWNKVETYISKHSQIKFSHGLCPDCMRRLYPDYSDDPRKQS